MSGRHPLHLDTTVVFTRVELLCALKHLRVRRDHISMDLRRLEERREAKGPDTDPIMNAAMLAVDTEVALLEAIIQRLWLPIASAALDETQGKQPSETTLHLPDKKP